MTSVARLLLIAVTASVACKGDGEGANGTKSVDERAVRSEPPAVFAELRIREEQYYLENGEYLSTGREVDFFPPASGEPGSKLMPEAWKVLRVQLERETFRCSYVVVAGKSGDAGNLGAIAKGFGFTPPAADWFYLLGRCPSIDKIFFASSDRDEIEAKPL